jgi:hypothetical protein
MHRIDSIGNVNNLFVDYDAINNPQGTVIDASFMNDLQEEVCNFIESRGITLVQGQQDQLELAIQDILNDKDYIALNDGTKGTPSVRFINDSNTGIFRPSADTLDIVTGGESRFRIEPTGQIKAVYESTLGTDYNTQLDNGYLCRAWVNFDGTSSNLTGTYTRSGNTITVSITSHGLSTGQTVYLDFTTGGATDGVYVVTVINANSYTVIDTASGTITTSNVTQFRYIRASGNVSSITDNGTGDYTVNLASSMPDSDYSVNINARGSNAVYVTSEIGLFKQATNTANNPSVGSFRFLTTIRGSNGVYDGLSDADYICVGVLR